MSVKPSDSVTCLFVTQNPTTGAATDADSLPVGTLYRNGTADGAVTVTVTKLDTGRYKAAFTLGTYTAGDEVSLSIAATVATVAGKGVVWQATLDSARLEDIEADLEAIQGAGWTTETLRVIHTAIERLLSVSDSIADKVGADTSETLEIRVASQWSEPFLNLGSVATRTKCWFTVKEQLADTDAEAIIQIEETGGLLILNGAAYGTAAHGSISWSSAANGDVTITLADDASALLTAARSLYYDIAVLEPTGKRIVTEGRLHITGSVTHAVS